LWARKARHSGWASFALGGETSTSNSSEGVSLLLRQAVPPVVVLRRLRRILGRGLSRS
jgi:hypothetical protein